MPGERRHKDHDLERAPFRIARALPLARRDDVVDSIPCAEDAIVLNPMGIAREQIEHTLKGSPAERGNGEALTTIRKRSPVEIFAAAELDLSTRDGRAGGCATVVTIAARTSRGLRK